MMKTLVCALIVAFTFAGISCTTSNYNTQSGAVVGAGLGAIAGQAIGRNTAGTLIGLAGGALVGAIVGNAVDQNEMNKRLEWERQRRAYAYPGGQQEAPPGQWVQVPGQWVGGRWVPAHRAWVPVNP